jgi:hypothetical protein
MRFYADENFPLAVVIELRKLGHDVLTTLEDERANQKFLTKRFYKEQSNSTAPF